MHRVSGSVNCPNHGLPPPFQHTDAVEFLIHSYPDFVMVESLPCGSAQDRVNITLTLSVVCVGLSLCRSLYETPQSVF